MRITKFLIAAGALAALCACGSTSSETRGSGEIAVSVRAVTSRWSVTRVSITAAPANVTKDLSYDLAKATFTGTLVLPEGEQTLSATAFAGEDPVGSGSATVTVTANATASVQMTILDTTGVPPVPDHPPYITTLVAPSTFFAVGESLALSATAVDIDADPITYLWSGVCPAGVIGTFSSPTAPATHWSANGPGTCKLRLQVTSKELSDARELEVTIYPLGGVPGTVEIVGKYIEHPVVEQVRLEGVSTGACRGISMDCPAPNGAAENVFPAMRSYFFVRVGYVASQAEVPDFSITDDCGGQFEMQDAVWGPQVYKSSPDDQSVAGWFYAGYWTAPDSPALCTITAKAALHGLSDTFPVAVRVSGCVDDVNEHDDTPATANYLGEVDGPHDNDLSYGYSYGYAHDDDWYSFTAKGSTLTAATIKVWTADVIEAELYGPDATTLIASGVNGVSGAITGDRDYYVRIKPGAAAATCNSRYEVKIEVQ